MSLQDAVVAMLVQCGNHACRNHPFTFSALHKDTLGGTKDLKFGLIRPNHRFPLLYCLYLVFLGPNKSLLLFAFS